MRLYDFKQIATSLAVQTLRKKVIAIAALQLTAEQSSMTMQQVAGLLGMLGSSEK